MLLVALVWSAPVAAQPKINAPDDHWFALDFYVGTVIPVPKGQGWDVAARVLLGYSVIKPYWYLSVGPVVGFSSRFFRMQDVYSGLGLDLIHVPSGLSGHLATVVSWDGGGGALFGVGWSVLSADLELVTHHGRLAPKIIFSLRFAVGGLSYALKEYFALKRRIRAALRSAARAGGR